jgi:hypothetical protein
MAARSLDAYLNSAGDLARLSAHAGRLVKLQRVYESIAPSYLAASSRVANYKLGKVVIHADSEVTEIQVKVQPNHGAPQHKKRAQTASVGTSAKSDLHRLAEALPEGSPLKEALERLVQRSR